VLSEAKAPSDVTVLNSRRFALGDLEHRDFEQAAGRHAATIFGIEDCDFCFAPQPPSGQDGTRVLRLRDPLNNLASRLEGANTRPDVLRTNEAFSNPLAAYCEEFLGQTKWSTGIQGPAMLIEMLFDHADIRETCATEFGYTFAERVKAA
jgi:hypothetical protein